MQIVRLTQTAPKRRKLLLVDPYPRENPYHLGPSERKAIWFPKLSLPAIAAYTPEHWDVEIQDEAVREIDLEHPADLVGISVMTCYAPRAYQLADEFRKRGVPVVLGGVHPTYCPDEALQHCDAIVTGEAEDSWPRLVADFEAGRMQRHYKMEKFPALENYKPPRVELLSDDAYMTRMCTFTTRGCHFDCEFCSVSPFNGKSTRRRPVPEVIAEMTRVKQWLHVGRPEDHGEAPDGHRGRLDLRLRGRPPQQQSGLLPGTVGRAQAPEHQVGLPVHAL